MVLYKDECNLDQIKESKYEAADLTKITDNQPHLNKEEQGQLPTVAVRYNMGFQGKVRVWKGETVQINTLPGAKFYREMLSKILVAYLQLVKMEMNRLVEIGVL